MAGSKFAQNITTKGFVTKLVVILQNHFMTFDRVSHKHCYPFLAARMKFYGFNERKYELML